MRITGKIRQMLKCHIQFRHYGTYLETSQASHIKGQNLHQVIDHSLLRKIWKPPVSCSKITHMVRLIKSLAGILATETVLTRRNQGTETNGKGTAVCKLCGIADETNLHMLCECTGNTELVTERRSWISKMRSVVKGTLVKYMNTIQLDVLLSLWNVDEMGKINKWVSDDRNLEATGIDPILLQLRVLIDKQKGVDNHMYGITTTAWREFLEDLLGIPPSIALKFQADLHRCTQNAIDKMWKARNLARHGMTSPHDLWELRVFEDAIRAWKSEADRQGRDMLDGAEERIRALPRKQKLTWVHNRLRKQKGIKEFWSTVPAWTGVDAEADRDLEMVADKESGTVGQLPPDIPSKVQVRVEREKERKQSYLEQYFTGGNSSIVTTRNASDAANCSAIGLGPRLSSTHSKKRVASVDLLQKTSKTSKTQISPSKEPLQASKPSQLEVTEADRLIMEDQAQLEEEDQVGDRPRTAVAPSQLTLISGVSEAARTVIARKKEEAITLKEKRKKARQEGGQVEQETNKKQKCKQSENLRKRNIVEEEEQTGPNKRQKSNATKRGIMEVEEAEEANSSKRKKSEGQDGCKQLGCSTHKGIS